MASGFFDLGNDLGGVAFGFDPGAKVFSGLWNGARSSGAIQFTGWVRMYSRSSRSFSVRLGRLILVFGRLTPLVGFQYARRTVF